MYGAGKVMQLFFWNITRKKSFPFNDFVTVRQSR